MPQEDPDAAEIVRRQMAREGARFVFDAAVVRAERREGAKALVVSREGRQDVLLCDAILVGIGRTPNTDGLGLEAAGVRYSTQGVAVDERLRTSNRRIYAAGDVCSRFKFTHAADAMARNVIANAFFFGRRAVSGLVIPWCTYTDPEIAHVGMYEAEALRAGYDVGTITQELADNDRAILDGETEGFGRVIYDRRRGKILGGTIVARHAGEMIGELTLAIGTGQKVGVLSSTIHPYPTQAEVLKRIGDTFMRGKLTPLVKTLFRKWFEWQR
jgi:pyruvate/2-oxoglutarate dehydrogenase complex dihydrolipoamide dehydrogenase (E3) component